MKAIATKFVKWDIQPLENLQGSKVYNLRLKLNNNGKLSREEKDWITAQVNHNTYFRSAIPLLGWRFDFSDVLKTFLVRQYGSWQNTEQWIRLHSEKSFSGELTR